MNKQNTEAAALDDLLSLLNNPNLQGDPGKPGTEGVPGADYDIMKRPANMGPAPTAAPLPPQPAPAKAPRGRPPTKSAAPAAPTSPAQVVPNQKLFFTGRLKAGKDTTATQAGAKIFGFADPLYAIASHYFGIPVNATEGKDLAGMRTFLQIIGQWGRGVISESYPLTVPRALLTRSIILKGGKGEFGDLQVDWASFGRNPDIWLNSCIARANEYSAANPAERVAITNCRFENEFKRLLAEGWQHWHCLCSPATWTERLSKSGFTPESPQVKDLSETLAIGLDQNVIKQVSSQKEGPMLRAIWSDRHAVKPSSRLHTVDTFLRSIGATTV